MSVIFWVPAHLKVVSSGAFFGIFITATLPAKPMLSILESAWQKKMTDKKTSKS